MISKTGLIEAQDFKTGLVTRSDIINSDPNQSPNCMDIKWYFDNVIGKRYGSSTSNSLALTDTAGAASFIVQQSLTTNLISYYKMDEASGTRIDSVAGYDLIVAAADPNSTTGIRNQASLFDGDDLLIRNSSPFGMAGSSFAISFWLYLTQTSGTQWIISFGPNQSNYDGQYDFFMDTSTLKMAVRLADTSQTIIQASSFGALSAGNWYNIVGWCSNATHVGLSVNLSANSSSISSAISGWNSMTYAVGALGTGGSPVIYRLNARLDEMGIWNRVLTATERAGLYAGGSGNTYTPNTGSPTKDSWYSFDFGASGARWYTVCAGTGIVASSNAGNTFVNIATSRTASFQYMDRSRNVLICTSDAYDKTLYWAGSAGTFANNLALNSAPNAKFSINYQGFLILLNSMDSNGTISNRRFTYADENLQLTDLYDNYFDLPSSADDEITGPFVLNKFLYVSTKYRIFRLNYTGGNPDWQYIQVKNFGYVPRTVKVFTLKQGQVAVGLDWSRRLRVFDGYDDQIISDNVENDHDYCEFAMQKISLAGSGLLVSNAEFDPNEQEYHLNVAIGAQSTQTTHALVLNARTLALYPYSNQQYSTITVVDSAGEQFLMAVDRSGFCHILNSGNLDSGVTPINEVYDTPLFFSKSPSEVTKNRQINFFFDQDSAGKLYYQERYDFSNVFSEMKPLRDHAGNTDLTGMESSLVVTRTKDLPSVQNIYQGRLTSSAGTANPWRLLHFDLFNTGLGYGRGK